jgi:hypothetical protein
MCYFALATYSTILTKQVFNPFKAINTRLGNDKSSTFQKSARNCKCRGYKQRPLKLNRIKKWGCLNKYRQQRMNEQQFNCKAWQK